ncbi:type II toxin-antitoxin system RelE/ParE family toxin [Marinomonas rhizomae]|uniref:type II toxin-antitoxin system RelE family toxin n=1 Tax=Marinomonas rhizomae TaxID=491948 RepID=UPI000DEB9832|nr:type II toxin-antitoxin system RelE/ParE family toxin [Marinomonas rhizomae]
MQTQFKKKLAEQPDSPHFPASRLRGYDCAYKIKLRTSGYRLAYEVIDDEVVVCVLTIGKQDNDAVYKSRLSSELISHHFMSFLSTLPSLNLIPSSFKF